MPTSRPDLAGARKAAGYTQESLAKAMGINRGTVRRWEAGEYDPSPVERPRLASLLRVTPQQLSALLSSTSPVDSPPVPMDELDRARRRVDDTLSMGTVTASRISLIEERVAEHITRYTRTAPLEMLSLMSSDLIEVEGLAAVRQPTMLQGRLSEALAVLASLTADALMKLGEVDRSARWHGSARLAADDTNNTRLQACVIAQAAMLPYYYGSPKQAVALAREAQERHRGTICDATALATAAEARALARYDHAAAADTVRRAEAMFDRLDSDSDDAFRFNLKRYLLYMSGTLTNLGDLKRAAPTQNEALRLYGTDSDLVIDPALIRLDQAVGLAVAGDVTVACDLARSVAEGLRSEHRTRIVLARAGDVLRALPNTSKVLPRARELHAVIEPDR